MKMTLQTLFLAALTLRVSAQPPNLFHTGDSFSYHFDTLPFITTGIGVGLIGNLNLSTGSPFLTGSVGYELFEGQPVGTPVVSGTFLAEGQAPFPPTAANLWLDLEGSFRITVLSGSQEIDRIDVTRYFPNAGTPGTFDVYSSSVVPEPGTLWLLAGAWLVTGVWLKCRKRWACRP